MRASHVINNAYSREKGFTFFRFYQSQYTAFTVYVLKCITISILIIKVHNYCYYFFVLPPTQMLFIA